MRFLATILDTLFPPYCAACDTQVQSVGTLCAPCFSHLREVKAPYCAQCGAPFAQPGDKGLCAGCMHAMPPYTRARTVWVYNDVSAALVGRLKFQDRTAMLAHYGAALVRAGGDVLAEVDLVMPVPLHWRRLVARRYNQSALLAYAMRRYVAWLPVDVRNLRRVRHTVPQTRLRGEERRRNVKGAFAVRDKAAVAGKVVLLVDDVMTTGATALACVKALQDAGAKEVRVLTLARTLRE